MVPADVKKRLEDKLDSDRKWTGGVNSDGYPKMKVNGKSVLAARVLLESLGRPPAPDQVVMHRDNNPKNLDPKNLQIGTQKQNLKHMRDEGRDRPRGVPQEPDVKSASDHMREAEIRDFLGRVRDEAKERNLRVFAVADSPHGGASITLGGAQSPAVRNARKAHTRWERRMGYDPHHDWSKEPTDTADVKTAGRLLALLKQADLKTTLLPHQQRVAEKMKDPERKGLVVVHGLGSGKTLTSIAAQDALGTPATVIVPAALQENYRKEQKKHLLGDPLPTEIGTLQRAAKHQKVPKSPLLIVDEAHKVRDASTSSHAAIRNAEADKKLLMTASPFYNHPSDLSSLVNIAAQDTVLPTNQRNFEDRYVTYEKVEPTWIQKNLYKMEAGEVPRVNPATAKELKEVYGKWVDHHKGSTEGFPTVERKTIDVVMSPEQKELYNTAIGSAPSWLQKKVRAGMPPSKREMQDLLTFLNGPRQISVSSGGFTSDKPVSSAKIDQASQNLKKMLDENPRAKAVVYSNYIDAGIKPYKKRLEELGIPHGEFTGELSAAARDQMVRDYNDNKIRALLLSSAGGEGLDLKGTRLVQVLDPHWNQEKIKQVEGRAARYKSHAHLPPEEQKVLVEQYLAYLEPKERKGLAALLLGKEKKNVGSADSYLHSMSQDKERLIGEFRKLLPESEEEWKTQRPEVLKRVEAATNPKPVDKKP